MDTKRTDCFVFQAEDAIRYLVRSRGLGDVYKRQATRRPVAEVIEVEQGDVGRLLDIGCNVARHCDVDDQQRRADAEASRDDQFVIDDDGAGTCPLYTSDAADERSSGDLGGGRIIKKNKKLHRE